MNVRRLALPMTALLALCACGALAQEPVVGSIVTPTFHPWGRFAPGAWKLVHVESESLDNDGRVVSTSVTETKSSLLRVEPDGVVLEVEVAVQVAGRPFEGQPQSIKQGFHGELAVPQVTYKPPEAAQVVLEGLKRDCKSQEIVLAGPNCTTLAHIYFSDAVWPHVLRRTSATKDSDGALVSETTSEVLAHDMPEKVLTEIKSAAYVQMIQKSPKGVVTTLSMSTLDVPGGVFSQSTKETDTAGRLVRRSTLKLVSYGLKPDEERPGLFGRKRIRRKVTSK